MSIFVINNMTTLILIPNLTSKQPKVKGPLKNYVILLGGGEVTKILHKITRGEGREI